MITKRIALISAIFLTMQIEAAYTKVTDVGAGGFTIKHSIDVNGSPAEVFRMFTAQIGAWWDASHTYSGKSGNLSMDLRPNGCFCEKLEDQGNVVHMTVVYVQPGKLLRMTGGLGPLQQFATTGVMTIEFAPQGQRTAVSLTYAIGGYLPEGFEKLGPLVDQVLVGQMSRYQRFVNTGKP